jgi:hypothetical protein
MYALDNPGAVKRTNARGEDYALYFSGESTETQNREVHVEEEKIAPADERSEVYQEFLSRLALSLEHRDNLISRGLGEEWIDRAMYRSMPSKIENPMIEDLKKRFGRSLLLSVPGFVEQSNRILFNCPTGILVPARDTKKRIIALKIRRAKTDAEPLPEHMAGLEGRPEARNLVGILAAITDTLPETVLREVKSRHAFC